MADEAGIRTPLLLVISAGAACLHLGRYDQAREHAERTLKLARDRGLRQGRAWALKESAQLNLVSESYQVALAQLEEATDVLREHEKSIWTLPLLYQAFALRRLGQRPHARQVLAEALKENMDTRVPWIILNALPAVALLVADQGDVELALELDALALRYPYVANSRWFEDVASRDIAAVAEALPVEAVAAARARGEARDLWETADELLSELRDMEL